MTKLPKASAWSRLCSVVFRRVWISKRVATPKLSTRGLNSRQQTHNGIKFEQLLKQRTAHNIFTSINGYQPPHSNGTFRRLMSDSGLEKNSEGQTRTFCSLRHAYATLELMENRIDIYTLAKQMGNSAMMIERHYSKLTVSMVAERLA
jgi:integrase